MNYLPKVVSVENMRQSDQRTIEQSVTSAELMHRAAKGIFDAVAFTGKVAIVCGSGNNGGDGYALACILAESGITPTVFRVSEKFSKDGLYYYQTAMSLGCEEGTLNVPSPLLGFDIVVDCILGTGFSGELCGEVKKAVEEINSCSAFVVSADINSGINGDTGIADTAVNSDLTVSIGSYKTGMFLNDAPYYIDKLTNADIGIEIIHEQYHLMDWEQLHMFEGYNSVVMTVEEFYEKTGYKPGECNIADVIAELSENERKIYVVKDAHSAVVSDIKYTYFCADYVK